jgi:hypothetical protein
MLRPSRASGSLLIPRKSEPIEVAEDTIAAIAKALEKAGVGFIPENGGGGGVRMKNWVNKR